MERSAAIGAGPFSFRGWIGLLRMDLKARIGRRDPSGPAPSRPEAGAHSHTMRGEERKKGGRRKERKKERKKGKGEKKRRKGFCMA